MRTTIFLFALVAACAAEQAPTTPSEPVQRDAVTLGTGGGARAVRGDVGLSLAAFGDDGADDPSGQGPNGPGGAVDPSESTPDPPEQLAGTDMPVAGGGAPEPVDSTSDVASPIPSGELANLLIVFDRSQSMGERWSGEPRWQAAGLAVARAMSALQPDHLGAITTGAVLLPTPDPNATPTCVEPSGVTCVFVPGEPADADNCMVAPGATSHIALTSGYDFLDAFTVGPDGAPFYFPIQSGSTPLREGLLEAQRALGDATLVGQTAVVVITDGEPDCGWDASVATSVVAEWREQGIITYVIGLPGPDGAFAGGAGGASALNAIAVAGGSVSMITPGSAPGMQAKLLSILRGEAL